MAFSFTSILPLPDMLALGWFFLCWVGYAMYADHRLWGTRWMRRVLERKTGLPIRWCRRR